MPHNCYDCDIHNYHECDLTSESIEEDYCWNGDSREKHCPLREVEAIPKADYETHLKADLKAILVELQLEIQEAYCEVENDYDRGRNYGLFMTTEIIQQKINAIKEQKDGVYQDRQRKCHLLFAFMSDGCFGRGRQREVRCH